ncbi:MAG: M24 family metallopeptidase [Spirochaetes bacterium]|nr:M24 family metallopeptidase [Spirochaetota bacterium]
MEAAIAIIDSSEKNSCLLYTTGFFSVLSMVYLEIEQEKIAWVPTFEKEKAQKCSKIDIIYDLNSELNKLQVKGKKPIKSELLLNELKKRKIHQITVPYDFPIFEGNYLINQGIQLTIKQYPLYYKRISKSLAEIAAIRSNGSKISQIMNLVKKILVDSSIHKNNSIIYYNKVLTFEFLQQFIFHKLLENNFYAHNVILAQGDTACHPHLNSHGEIKAFQPIIIDIFPRSQKNFYYTDMTRTFCKGDPGPKIFNMYQVVKNAYQIIISEIKGHCEGKELHLKVLDYFSKNGYQTTASEGFLHSSGHGIGLDCHELPSLSFNSGLIKQNSTLAIEPGLYYFNQGAIRLEDTVLVTQDGCEVLTKFDLDMVIL